MHRIRSIIVPTDFFELSQAATARAITLARLDGASIHLVHALKLPLVTIPYEAPVPAAVLESIRKAAHKKLEEARRAIEGKGVSTVSAEICESGNVVQAIDAAIKAQGADLVVMGTHGRSGFQHAFLGSVAERTLRTVDCPVLAVKEAPEEAAQPITRILVAADFSQHSDCAIDVAAGLAKRLAATVDVIHAFELPWDYALYEAPYPTGLEEKIRASVTENMEGLRARFEASQLPVTLHTRRGHPSVVIAKVAEEIGCQLIVMGTRGKTGLSHVLFGSVAERTIRTAPCSVLAVTAEERQCDV